MNFEKLSAGNLDKAEGLGSPSKVKAAEHLRETRNILSPFIDSYVTEVKGDELSVEALDKLKYHGFKGQVSTNFYGFLIDLENEPDITLRDIDDICNNYGDEEQEVELAYDAYCRRRKLLDSEENKTQYMLVRSKIQSLLKENNLSDQDIDFRTIDYIQENTTDLRLTNRWDNLPRGMGTKVLWGNPLSSLIGKESFPPVLVFPVGEYGTEVARKIYNTIQIMLDKTVSLERLAAELADNHKDVFAITARGEEDLRKNQDMSVAALKMLQEGIVTLGQAVAQLSFQRVAGYENDPDKFIEQIIKNDLPNQLGYLAPPAFIGPFSLLGVGIYDLVRKDMDEKLRLNPTILEEFQEQKNTIIKMHHKFEETYMPAAGRGCPVSFKGKGIHTTGINELSNLFLEIYKRIQ